MLRSDSESINAKGAHGIPLLPHAALSGNVELCRMLWQRGARQGSSMALHNAVSRGKVVVTRWILENASPDLRSKNYEGKTALALALERKIEDFGRLLREHGATE